MTDQQMRNLKATPGPWFLINDHCVGGPIEPEWKEAGCGIAHCGMRARTQDEATANAHLIAAAPELYEALSDLVAAAELEFPSERLSFARDALAKARGGGV